MGGGSDLRGKFPPIETGSGILRRRGRGDKRRQHRQQWQHQQKNVVAVNQGPSRLWNALVVAAETVKNNLLEAPNKNEGNFSRY